MIKTFAKYCTVGLVTTCIYFLSMFIWVEQFHVEPVQSSVLSFIIMTVCSFYLNVIYTFGGELTKQKFVRFSLVACIGFLLNFSLMYLVIEVLHFHYFVGEVVTTLIIPTVNFLLNHFWALRTELDTPGSESV